MQIRPIRTDKDHRAALAEIEKFWGASSGTPERDKLDILATLVETYRAYRLKTRNAAAPISTFAGAIPKRAGQSVILKAG
jgi:antitoxin component HigA of HigAB toxin-antitoxin module